MINSILDIVKQLDLVQACLLLRNLGDFDQDLFTIRGTSYQTSLHGLLRNTECMRPISMIAVIFEGGPTRHTRCTGSISTFIADRILFSMTILGKNRVMKYVDDIITWKYGDAPFDEERSEEWDELSANERYAG